MRERKRDIALSNRTDEKPRTAAQFPEVQQNNIIVEQIEQPNKCDTRAHTGNECDKPSL